MLISKTPSPITFGKRPNRSGAPKTPGAPKQDPYTFGAESGKHVTIPQSQFHLVEKKLEVLVSKIRAGDYIVEPTSTRRWNRNFKHGITFARGNEGSDMGRLYMLRGNVTLRPRDRQSDLKAVHITTGRSNHLTERRFTLQIDFQNRQGGTMSYRYAQTYVRGVLFELGNALAQRIQQIRNGEADFDPEQFKNLQP